MNEEAKKQLTAILDKADTDLTETDKAILNARRAYLTDEQRKRYPFLKKNDGEGAVSPLSTADDRHREDMIADSSPITTTPTAETQPVPSEGDHSADPDWKG